MYKWYRLKERKIKKQNHTETDYNKIGTYNIRIWNVACFGMHYNNI